MTIETLEQRYGDFYVPAFGVSVDGQDLVRDLFLSVTSVEVDLQQKAAGRFSLTVANAFDWEKREFVGGQREDRVDLLDLFAFGARVQISCGYGDPTGLPVLLQGMVTEVGTSFAEGGVPELSVAGYDDLYFLSTGKKSDSWEQKLDSDVVPQLVAETGLRAQVQATTPVKERIDRNEETGLAFLQKLAERNGCTFYVREGSLYFGPRNNTSSAVLELGWGKGLLSFSPQANLAGQVQEVRVHGESVETGQAIVGRAGSGQESGDEGESASQRVATALNNQPVSDVRLAVHSQAEADERARAILEELGQGFVTGEGESIGLPEILPDLNITLSGLGTTFSKTYYVSSAKHSISGGGYRTSFSVQEARI